MLMSNNATKPIVALWFCCLYLCAVTPAMMAEELTFKSRFYTVTTNLDKAQAIELAKHMDKVYVEYTRRTRGLKPKSNKPMNLFLWKSKQDYLNHLQSIGINGTNSGGMFFVRPHVSGLSTFVEGCDRDELLARLQHEGFHQFAYAKIGDLPVWVNEGLAVYFEQAILVRGKFITGQVNPRSRLMLIEAINNKQQLPFYQFLHITSDQWRNNMQTNLKIGHLQYAQAWSIVHFLAHANPRYQRALEQYLAAINRGSSSSVAFKRAFGNVDYKEFEAIWQQYLNKLEDDPLSIARQRMAFLAEGMRWLDKHKVNFNNNLPGLKKQLQRHKFWMSIGMHAAAKLEASDDQLFEPPVNERGKPATIQLIPQAGADQLPNMKITGLKTDIELIWTHQPDGQWIYRFEYR